LITISRISSRFDGSRQKIKAPLVLMFCVSPFTEPLEVWI
jgi:hypothetical protein